MQFYTITSARASNWSGATGAGEEVLASLSKNAPKIDCTLSHASLQLHIRHLRSWGGKEEREDKERRKLAGTWGKERRNLQESSFMLATTGLIFGMNKGTCSHEYLLWLITAIYVGNYQVSYMIILYP